MKAWGAGGEISRLKGGASWFQKKGRVKKGEKNQTGYPGGKTNKVVKIKEVGEGGGLPDF